MVRNSYNLFSGCILLFFATQLQAQELESLLALSLDELTQIEVSSTSYFEETIISSPNTVTYINQQKWLELGARNIGELLNHFPATVAVPYVGGTRGIYVRGYLGGNVVGGVAVRIDGVPVNKLRPGTGSLDIDGYDLSLLSSMEYIRGPGSALHGIDAFHGVLSLNSIELEDGEHVFNVGLGSDEEANTSVAGKFAGQSGQIILAGAYRQIGDQQLEYAYTDPDTSAMGMGKRSNALENSNALIKYQSDISAETHWNITGYFLDLDAEQLPGSGRSLGGTSQQKDQDWSASTSETQLLKFALEHELNSHNDVSVSAYVWQNTDTRFSDYSRTILGTSLDEYREEFHWGLLGVNRLFFTSGAQLAYGYEYRSGELKASRETLVSATGVIVVDNETRQESGYNRDIHSLVFDGQYPIDLLQSELVFGLRVDEYKKFDRQVSPRMGFITNYNNWVTKVLYGAAYRAPNLLELYGSSSVLDNFELQPEKIDTLEFVALWHSDHLLGSITLFKNWWDDAIRLQFFSMPDSNGFLAQFENEGRNEAQGIEAELDYSSAVWQANFSVSYVDTENIDSGITFEAFPQWIVDLGIGYQLSDQLSVHCATRYSWRESTSSNFLIEGGTGPSVDYTRVDLVAEWRLSANVISRLAVRNLFDRDNSLPSAVNHEGGLPDNGRNASVGVSWSF